MIGFVVLAAVMIAGALGVILLREPVHAALSLVGTLLALAVTYVTLEAHFLAAIQVIVYAGAIMVLFLFVIMLLNVGGDEEAGRLPALRPVAWIAGLAVAAVLASVVASEGTPLPAREQIAAALGGGGAERVGESLFGEFLLAFHLVGVLLLTGILGAVSLVQRRAVRAVGPSTEAGDSTELTHA